MWVEDGIWFLTLSHLILTEILQQELRNFIDTNLAVIDGNYGAVYGWNGSSYTIYNLLDGAFSIAPGQGFWIAACK